MNRRLPMDENGSIPLDDLYADRRLRETIDDVSRDACERAMAKAPRLRVLKGTRATACLGPAGRIAIAGARR